MDKFPIIIHKVKYLDDWTSLRKFKISGIFDVLLFFFESYLSLVDFGNVILFNKLLLRVENLAGILPQQNPETGVIGKNELFIYFEPVEQATNDAKRLHDFVKDCYKFDKDFKKTAVNVRRFTEKIVILVPNPPFACKVVSGSSGIVEQPSLLTDM